VLAHALLGAVASMNPSALVSAALILLVGSTATAAPGQQQRIVSRGVPGDGASQKRHVIGDRTVAALRSRWPVRGPITSDFGPRGRSARIHSGVDIGAEPGTPCRIAAAGTVVFAGWKNGYGKTIIVDHGDRIQTLYGHLSKIGVSRGQPVEQGAVLGSTGTTGHVSGPHLHYEILVNGRPVDPGPYLAAAPGVQRLERLALHDGEHETRHR
jgi:murein DD-endopeptidase MepM/ murein hydrolase activator NlpD